MLIENYIQFDSVNETVNIVLLKFEPIDISDITYELATFLQKFHENEDEIEEFFLLKDDLILKVKKNEMTTAYIFTINKIGGFHLDRNRINDLIIFLYTKDLQRYEHLKNPITSFKDL